MMRRFSSARREVAVDECPGCGGFWLDQGELLRIRTEFPTEEARRKASERLLGETHPEDVGTFAAGSVASAARSRSLAWVFQLLSTRW
jgi:hypothetical protein